MVGVFRLVDELAGFRLEAAGGGLAGEVAEMKLHLGRFLAGRAGGALVDAVGTKDARLDAIVQVTGDDDVGEALAEARIEDREDNLDTTE